MSAILTVLALISALSAAGMFIFQLRKLGRKRPCYRCAAVATRVFLGLHYCVMCEQVIMRTQGAVNHDPPFGYPGSPGYLEFPVEKERR